MSCQNIDTPLNGDETEVEIVKWNSNGKLGFSITGGVGSQHIRGDDGIYVKSVQDGGLVSWDGRIWVGDQIVAVKSGLDGKRIDFTGCTHEVAVSILRKVCSGTRVVLILKKCDVTLINWRKNDPLGFSISGGIDKEHIPGDSRIYITRIVEGGNASNDGRLSIGDRILGVKQNLKTNGMRSEDFFLMENCTHDDAVSALQEARKGKNVILMISKGNDTHNRLRFDDKEMMGNNQDKLENNSLSLCRPNISQNKMVIPLQSHNKTYPSKTTKTIKSILKTKNTSYPTAISNDEGFGDSIHKTKNPIRIRYITGEPIDDNEPIETLNQLSNSEIKKRNCYNTPMPALEKNFEDLSLIRGNDKRHESGNSSSSSCSINDNDSALSSMSSEDESFLLNFSHVENALLEDKRPKFVHQRQRSRHFIEPLISKSEGPVAQFFRPVLDKERMFLSTVQKDGITSSEILKQNSPELDENSNVPIDEDWKRSNKYFHQRYNISNPMDICPNRFQRNASNNIKSSVVNYNTKQFVKITKHYQL